MNADTDSRLFALFSVQRGAIDNLIGRLALELPSKKERTIFLINNYNLIVSLSKVTVLSIFFFSLSRNRSTVSADLCCLPNDFGHYTLPESKRSKKRRQPSP